jgi:hypothetical protein
VSIFEKKSSVDWRAFVFLRWQICIFEWRFVRPVAISKFSSSWYIFVRPNLRAPQTDGGDFNEPINSELVREKQRPNTARALFAFRSYSLTTNHNNHHNRCNKQNEKGKTQVHREKRQKNSVLDAL